MRHLLCAVLLLIAAPATRAGDKAKPNTLTPKEIADGWLLLFDGKTTFGWKAEGEVKVSNGALVLGGPKKSSIINRTGFQDYDLHFECLPGGKGAFHPGWQARGRTNLQNLLLSSGTWRTCVLQVRGSEETEHLTFTSPGGGGGSTGGRPVGTPKPWGVSRVVLAVDAGCKITLRNVKLRPVGLKSIFNGKNLAGWKVFPGKKSKFTVTDKGELHVKDGPGDLQTEKKWKDFVLQLECRTNGKHLNSGVFFRCRAGEYQNGYEAQIRNQFTAEPKQKYKIEECDPQTHTITIKEIRSPAVDYGTGAIYRRMPARLLASKDTEWFTMTVVAQGSHFATWVNGIQVVDWDDCRPLSDNARKGCCLNAGHLSLQGHDPTTDLNFRNFRIAELPAPPEK